MLRGDAGTVRTKKTVKDRTRPLHPPSARSFPFSLCASVTSYSLSVSASGRL